MESAQDVIKRSATQLGRKTDIAQLGALIRENKFFSCVHFIKLRISNKPVITIYSYKEALTYEGHAVALKWLGKTSAKFKTFHQVKKSARFCRNQKPFKRDHINFIAIMIKV